MHAQGLKRLSHSYVCKCIRAKAGASIHLRGRPCRQVHKKSTPSAYKNTCTYTCARCCKYENRNRHTIRHGTYVKCTSQRRRNRHVPRLLITCFHYLYFGVTCRSVSQRKKCSRTFVPYFEPSGKVYTPGLVRVSAFPLTNSPSYLLPSDLVSRPNPSIWPWLNWPV